MDVALSPLRCRRCVVSVCRAPPPPCNGPLNQYPPPNLNPSLFSPNTPRRSVAISPASHQQRTLHSEPVLRRVNPGGLAQLRPLRGVSQQSELVSAKAPPKHQLLQHRSKSESSLVRKWHVEHASLPSRPDDLRTTRVVFSASPADVISNRISDCLQSRSIKTKFSKTDGNEEVP